MNRLALFYWPHGTATLPRFLGPWVGIGLHQPGIGILTGDQSKHHSESREDFRTGEGSSYQGVWLSDCHHLVISQSVKFTVWPLFLL